MTSEYAFIRFEAGNEEHVAAHDRLMRQAFGTTAERNAELRDGTGTQGIHLLSDGDTIVASINAQTCNQYVAGHAFSCLLLAGVAVAIEARGKGIGKQLLQQVVAHAAKENIALVSLYPSTMPYYERCGFGISAFRTAYKAYSTAFVPMKKPALPVHMCTYTPEMQPLLASIYTSFHQPANGCITRNAYLWSLKAVEQRSVPKDIFLFGDKQKPEGYAVLEYTKTDTLHLKDWAVLTPQALDGLIALLSTQQSNWKYIRWFGLPADPLLHRLKEYGVPYPSGWVDEHTPLLTHCIDPTEILTHRHYPKISDRLQLHYSNPLQAAEEVYECVLDNGRMTVNKTAKNTNDEVLTISAQGLTALISGSMAVNVAALSGLVSGSPAALSKAQAMFATTVPYCVDQY